MDITKILVAGIGAVGGFFGGTLAHHYEDDNEVNIYFLARGEHLKKIQKQGLKVVHGENSFIAKPTASGSSVEEFGIMDFVLISSKSYDLENVIDKIGPCINKNTIIIPLLNGVDSRDRIQNKLPNNLVLDGCVYIISRLKEPGLVLNSGNIQKLFFGGNTHLNNRLTSFEKVLSNAGIEATYSNNISTVIWEKFIFVSSIATATSYFNQCLGKVLENEKMRASLTLLIQEVSLLASAKNIQIDNHIVQKSLEKMESLPYETTSSLHSDIIKGSPNNELFSLCGFIVEESSKFSIFTPTYHTFYELLSKVKTI